MRGIIAPDLLLDNCHADKQQMAAGV